MRPPPLAEVRPQGPFERQTGVGFELVFDPVVPQMAEQLVEVPVEVVVGVPNVDIPVPGRGPPGHGVKVSSQNRVLLLLSSRSLTFQFQGVVFLAVQVFKVFTQDRVPLNAPSSSSLTFQYLVAVFKIFSQFRAPKRLPQTCLKSRFKGFSHFSLASIKVRRSPGRCVPESPRTSAHPRCALIKWLVVELAMRAFSGGCRCSTGGSPTAGRSLTPSGRNGGNWVGFPL